MIGLLYFGQILLQWSQSSSVAVRFTEGKEGFRYDKDLAFGFERFRLAVYGNVRKGTSTIEPQLLRRKQPAG